MGGRGFAREIDAPMEAILAELGSLLTKWGFRVLSQAHPAPDTDRAVSGAGSYTLFRIYQPDVTRDVLAVRPEYAELLVHCLAIRDCGSRRCHVYVDDPVQGYGAVDDEVLKPAIKKLNCLLWSLYLDLALLPLRHARRNLLLACPEVAGIPPIVEVCPDGQPSPEDYPFGPMERRFASGFLN